jgi:hypothetical protein
MSAPNPAANSTSLPGLGDGTEVSSETTAGLEAAIDASHLADGVGLELASLLANSRPGDFALASDAGASDAQAYDGHVALELDAGLLPDIDSTLDLLTSSHQLFDVPALDVASVLDDSLPT